MSCEHDCDRPAIFPLDIENRPGLEAFRYRIGTYARMRGHMLDRLVKSGPLQDWSHLSSDEPGIALLEGASAIGDILTLYQELYANETKLGTANWDDTLRDLVRLTGYRPAPGLAGEALFGLEVEGGPVDVPVGFPIEAQLGGFDAPSIFETDAPATAYEAFNAFHLYRRRGGDQAIGFGERSLDIVSADSQSDLDTRTAASEDIAEGDRIILFSDAFAAHEILVVERVETHLDRVTLHFQGSVQQAHPAEVTAYRLGRTFRHYGADAQPQFTSFDHNPPDAPVVSQHATQVTRRMGNVSVGGSFHTQLGARQMPLDSEVDDLAIGSAMIFTGRQTFLFDRDFVRERIVRANTPQQVIWANQGASVSVIEIDLALNQDYFFLISELLPGVLEELSGITATTGGFQALPASTGPGLQQLGGGGSQQVQFVTSQLPAQLELLQPGTVLPPISFEDLHDIQRLRMHETLGPRLRLKARPVQRPGIEVDGLVNFFGTREEAEALAARSLLLEGGTEAPQPVMVSPEQDALAALPDGPEGDRRMWPIRLLELPLAGPGGFAEVDPAVTVYGNLVEASEGETQDEATIGSGDARVPFQTFAIPKPVSRHADAARTPPLLPALEIRVAGRLWSEVDMFFDQPAEAEIYILRQGVEGNDAVQFGDGINGARLPSGRNNVTAFWRTGTGARGDLAEDAEPKATEKLKPLTGVLMPGPATGGADPETMENARAAAPARMQTLGRLVGLADYEAEALTVPGVLKTGATFGSGFVPAIDVTVLTEDESPEAIAAVEAAMRSANRCRGPARHPVTVTRGRRRWVALTLQLGLDPVYRAEDLLTAVSAALGAIPVGEADARNGLMALANRAFGQDAHVSQTIAAAQAVEGVIWVEAKAFARLSGFGDDPAEIPLPAAVPNLDRLLVAPDQVLLLSAHHLVLDPVAVTSDEECPT